MSFITDAAKYYSAKPHQDRAWEALWASLPDSTKEEFKTAYRATPPPEKVKDGIITKQVFAELTGYASSLFTDQEVIDCNNLLRVTGFDKDIDATCMLMANILHETCNMKYMKEIASGEAYNGRSDLGNTQPGDGPRFKGAGVLQLTGRHNYTRLSKALGDPRVLEGVDYVSSKYPFTSARTWIDENYLLACAQTKGFDAVCRRINGGWNGYDDRLRKYNICRRVLR